MDRVLVVISGLPAAEIAQDIAHNISGHVTRLVQGITVVWSDPVTTALVPDKDRLDVKIAVRNGKQDDVAIHLHFPSSLEDDRIAEYIQAGVEDYVRNNIQSQKTDLQRITRTIARGPEMIRRIQNEFTNPPSISFGI